MTDKHNMIERTYEWQVWELWKVVENDFIQQDPQVKGKFTSGDYIEMRLFEIFGPENYSVELLGPVQTITISPIELYAQAQVRLHLTFANQAKSFQDAVGVWPLKAAKDSTLENTPSERYETATKAAVTDAIKCAIERVGHRFRTMAPKSVATADYVMRVYNAEFHPQKKLTDGERKEKQEAVFGENTDTRPMPDTLAEAYKQGHQDGKKNGNSEVKLASIKGAIPDWQKMCKEFADKYPAYQAIVNGKPNGQPNYMHILKAAALEGYPEVTAQNAESVIEALSARASRKEEMAKAN